MIEMFSLAWMTTMMLTAGMTAGLLLAAQSLISRMQTRVSPAQWSGDILEVVRLACRDVGLNHEDITTEFDLRATGKLYDVLHHASETLGKDHELRTVGDVVSWLTEAPEKKVG